jgi:hypothetical protein
MSAQPARLATDQGLPVGASGARTPPETTSKETIMSSKKKPAPKAAEAAQTVQAQTAVKKVAALKTPDLLKGIADLQVQLTAGLGSIQGTLSGAMNQFEDITLAISAQEARLKELYEIEGEAQRIEEVRAIFEEARTEHVQWIQERDLGRIREESEFNYQRDIRRRKEQDEFEQKKAIRDRELAERAAIIEAAEQELHDLTNRVGNFPKELFDEAAAAERRVAERLTREHEHALALLAAQTDGDKKLLAATIEGLRTDNQRLQNQMTAMNQQLTKALDQVREIAAKAVEGAGAVTALAALQSTLQGQAGPKAQPR